MDDYLNPLDRLHRQKAQVSRRHARVQRAVDASKRPDRPPRSRRQILMILAGVMAAIVLLTTVVTRVFGRPLDEVRSERAALLTRNSEFTQCEVGADNVAFLKLRLTSPYDETRNMLFVSVDVLRQPTEGVEPEVVLQGTLEFSDLDPGESDGAEATVIVERGVGPITCVISDSK